MRKTSTILRRFFDVYDYIEYFMRKHLEGFTPKDMKKAFIIENPFGIKSFSTLETYAQWIIGYYIKDFQRKSLDVFARFITSPDIPKIAKRELIFWRTCRKDSITAELTKKMIYQNFVEGESHVPKDEIKNFITKKTNFSESTIRRTLTGYLRLLERLGIVRLSGEKVELRYYIPKLESVSYVVFYLLETHTSPKKILESDDFKYFLLDERGLISYLKDMQLEGIIEFAMAGDIVRIEPKMEFEVLIDAFKA
ncbi:MAG: hypothetical protein PWQ20_1674 [Thermotogaceae bacterium]|nr:hypothetical protein [Thermotogaceae bacterium]